jgi:hypothetical protein
MDLLSRLERALEGMVEGVFSRAFRTQLQPIEVAKRLTRALEEHRAVSVSSTYVPNVFTVRLAPETYVSFEAISGRLLGELEQYLREFIADREYCTVGAVAVRLAEGEGLKPHEMAVEVANDPAATPSAAQAPAVLRSYAEVGHGHGAPSTATDETTAFTPPPPTLLEVASGPSAGRQIALVDGLTIGRGPDATLDLQGDALVSRRHAEVTWTDEQWRLRDLASRNGTFANGHRITDHTLRLGDTVQVGETLLTLR